MDKWVDFYQPYFADRAATEKWVAQCEALAPPHNHAKIMMHQAQRLVSIADDMPKIKKAAESLQLLFHMICAEHVSKLHDKFDGEGKSRAYVQRFFDLFVVGEDRKTMEVAFTDHTQDLMPLLSFGQAVDLLYGVRCDVVHEGNYWGFSFHDGSTPMLNTEPDVTTNITIGTLRDIVVRGCINAVTNRLSAP